MLFKRHYLLFLFLTMFSALLFYKLVSFPRPLFDWDESLYVQNGIEMIKSSSYLVPRWQGQAWLDKPPLSPLLLGIVALSTPLPVEISTRLYTLALSICALVLIYIFYYRLSRSQIIATLTVALTAFMPIFLQRSQVVSLDITLLIGWLGFWLFCRQKILATTFLFLSVQSKSLLGFYPLALYAAYQLFRYFTKEIKFSELIIEARTIAIQTGVLSIWYIAAWAVYGNAFWQQHIIESHFRRVSASLESHFGQRTFYLDLAYNELGWWTWLSIVGFLTGLYLYLKKKINSHQLLLMNAFLPWFLFLNLTKTKIAWYLYPVLPQLAFYAAYFLRLIKPKLLQVGIGLALIGLIVYQGIWQHQLLTQFYSSKDPHIQIAQAARSHCPNLAVLVPNYTRDTYATLKSMHLTIHTTSWWGEHPSMVYYFQKPLRFFYTTNQFRQSLPDYQCAVVNTEDKALVKQSLKLIGSFDKMHLYQK